LRSNWLPPQLILTEDKSEKAAGWIITLIKPDQRVHIKGMEDNPVKMWERLETVHVVKQAGARFNSYDSFFSIRKKEDESLVALTTWIDGAMQTIQSLRPNTFTLQTLDEELFCMAMIRSLPEDYNTLTTSLLLKGTLDKDIMIQAFQTEESQRQQRATIDSLSSSTTKALAASSSPPHHHDHSHSHSSEKICDFCGYHGHILPDCWKFQKAQKEEKKRTAENKAKKKQGARKPQEESAGNASLLSSSTSNPTSHFSWNADSGASSHMTSHREWFLNYTPYCAPVRLADNTLIHSAGRGDVEIKAYHQWPEEETYQAYQCSTCTINPKQPSISSIPHKTLWFSCMD
jgi:hypothetical protein